MESIVRLGLLELRNLPFSYNQHSTPHKIQSSRGSDLALALNYLIAGFVVGLGEVCRNRARTQLD
jgi:hypothetical protein